MPNRPCPPGSNRGANGVCTKACPRGEPRNVNGKCDEDYGAGGLYAGAGSVNNRKKLPVKYGGRRTRSRARKNRRTRRR
jgi:hypothetical protein